MNRVLFPIFVVIAVLAFAGIPGSLSQPPAFAQALQADRPTPPAKLINTNQFSCQFSTFTTSSGSYVAIPGSVVLVAVPQASNVIVTYSTEIRNSGNLSSRADLAFSINNGPFGVFGPEFFHTAGTTSHFQIRTARVVIPLGSAGVHNIRAGTRVVGGGNTTHWFRCLTAEAYTN